MGFYKREDILDVGIVLEGLGVGKSFMNFKIGEGIYVVLVSRFS